MREKGGTLLIRDQCQPALRGGGVGGSFRVRNAGVCTQEENEAWFLIARQRHRRIALEGLGLHDGGESLAEIVVDVTPDACLLLLTDVEELVLQRLAVAQVADDAGEDAAAAGQHSLTHREVDGKNGTVFALPDDFTTRLDLVDARRVVDLGPLWTPFTRAYDLVGDGSLLGVPLPGHAPAQLGVLLRTEDDREVLLAAEPVADDARDALRRARAAGIVIDWTDFAELSAIAELQQAPDHPIWRGFILPAQAVLCILSERPGEALPLLAAAEACVQKVQQPYTLGWLELAKGMTGYLEGKWKRCHEHCVRAEGYFNRCTGAWWERATVHLYATLSLFWMGEMGEQSRRVERQHQHVAHVLTPRVRARRLREKALQTLRGDRVVALLPDGSTTLKTFYKEDDHIRLQPANPNFEPIRVRFCQVQGVVKAVVRRYGR